MTAIADLIKNLRCNALKYGYEQVQFEQLDMKCPEVEENKIVYEKIINYLWLLNSGCDLDIDKVCEIESFVNKHPCTCETCSLTCEDFTISETASILCSGFDVTEYVDDP